MRCCQVGSFCAGGWGGELLSIEGGWNQQVWTGTLHANLTVDNSSPVLTMHESHWNSYVSSKVLRHECLASWPYLGEHNLFAFKFVSRLELQRLQSIALAGIRHIIAANLYGWASDLWVLCLQSSWLWLSPKKVLGVGGHSSCVCLEFTNNLGSAAQIFCRTGARSSRYCSEWKCGWKNQWGSSARRDSNTNTESVCPSLCKPSLQQREIINETWIMICNENTFCPHSSQCCATFS